MLQSLNEEYDEQQNDQSNENNEKRIFCSDCDASFSKMQPLKSHFASVHEGKQLYQCSECEASYTTHTGLRYHCKIVHKGCLF